MASLATVKTTGAVGTKLYYPESKRMQHCGIYNIHVGPVHKLQFKEDIRPYYDRRNLDVRRLYWFIEWKFSGIRWDSCQLIF